jgi:hypothetical protein
MDNVVELPRSDDPFAKYNTPQCKLYFPVGERRVAWETRQGTFEPTRSHKAIIRLSPDGTSAMPLNVVGASYKLVHNRELFTAVETAMHDEMLPEHLADVQVMDKVSGFGKVCLRQYIFPSIRCRIPNTRSDIAFRIIVQNGYGGSALRMHAGAIDFYCTNGMIRGEYTSTYRKHTSGLVVGHLNSTVKSALQEFANGTEQWTEWANKPVRFEQAMKLFEHIALSAKMKDSLNDQFTREVDVRGANLWAVYSTLTYYASHSDGAFGLRRTVEEQDTVATTMLGRELNVSRWTHSDAWHELETA